MEEQALGPEHPVIAYSLNTLAALLREQGDFAGVRPLYERALAIREKTLGPEHASTAESLNNLSILLAVQEDFAGARPLVERALTIKEKALGPEHPNTASSLSCLGDLLRLQGELREARPLLERALAIQVCLPVLLNPCLGQAGPAYRLHELRRADAVTGGWSKSRLRGRRTGSGLLFRNLENRY
jgi:tetratricopeptide (TPR) repeat protein